MLACSNRASNMAASVRFDPMRCSPVAIAGGVGRALTDFLGGGLMGSLVGWGFEVVFEFARCEKVCEVWRLLRVVCWAGWIWMKFWEGRKRERARDALSFAGLAKTRLALEWFPLLVSASGFRSTERV